VQRSEDQDRAYRNRDNDPRGPWKTSDLSARNFYGDGTYSIACPSGRIIEGPPRGRYWTISKTKFDRLNQDNRIWWGQRGDAIPQLKRFLAEVKQGVVPQTLWPYGDVGHTQEAKKELVSIVPFGTSDDVFITPKPTRLIQRILQIASDKDSLILDSFAGSGTTGHAVLKQNAEDGGNRRFLLVEMDPKIAREVTAERVRRVAQGYANTRGEPVEGLGGDFRFCELSAEPLFTAEGQVRADVRFAQLAEFVWFVETGSGLPGQASTPPSAGRPRPSRAGFDSPLLGVHEGRAVYLLYNGIIKDKSVNGGNVLTSAVLDVLPPFDGPRVVYAAACRLGTARLARDGIVFRQTPYALDV
jgi:site-specific DNA-methyltransferase (adenine-specific)/adenine-specific DNA-methyltransferase